MGVSNFLCSSLSANLLPALYLWKVRPCSSTKSNTLEVAETLDDLDRRVRCVTRLCMVEQEDISRPIKITDRGVAIAALVNLWRADVNIMAGSQVDPQRRQTYVEAGRKRARSPDRRIIGAVFAQGGAVTCPCSARGPVFRPQNRMTFFRSSGSVFGSAGLLSRLNRVNRGTAVAHLRELPSAV